MMNRLLTIMQKLRNPQGGCPWDVAQDFSTIAPYTIEEAYEVADAIEREDFADLRDELGDLLFQVVFHAQMASEAGAFEFTDVVAAICDKMERRHPHVFAGAAVESAEAQAGEWERMKADEREAGGDSSALAGIARGLPEWMRAGKLHRRAARVGFDWPDADSVLEKVSEELDELRGAMQQPEHDRHCEEELGDLLFAALALAQHLEVDAGRAPAWRQQKVRNAFFEPWRRPPAGGHLPS